MTDFDVHDIDSAPADAKPLLEGAKKNFGFVPNLLGVLAESPVALETYLSLGSLVGKTSFTPTERTVVWLSIIHANDCTYCMAAHTGIAKSEQVDGEVIEALRAGEPLADARLEALRKFAVQVVEQRGWVAEADLEAFLAAGFTKQHVLEVLVGVAHKTLSNYANHLADTPVDRPFERFAWSKPTGATSG